MSRIVNEFRRSLDEVASDPLSDACAMEEDFLLDLLEGLDPCQPVYCQMTGAKKGAVGHAQRRNSDPYERGMKDDAIQVDLSLLNPTDGLPEVYQQVAVAGAAGALRMPMPFSDSSSCSTSSFSGSVSGSFSEQDGWHAEPMVSPEQMAALGRMVKAQRSSVSTPSGSTTSPASVETGG
jgi:hypothetical protein|mmetsp:Transcript_48321/g.108861  ORF Transcript_48321/g.108861 Transcript_48321/m.108861 type:complete len:179 (-) Transcript_48321:611-1147(-)|eukprot:CAMPEP_0181199820 /NCGR_PEP_ID=MMETSP1096-20121128/17396_1 /TAXON_ID=156174 ORGANISM="Chrysochromulina ericina, Strain CCMP281" /NCGR_SAMPLE_ID=MMETSP1096 /ASSEMBLY_ACC=CAM_ASM_000453 /LENGTH=178 /DNA_ID=CAMNT_0023290059 /DNA_START=59 /DNA_END=595 /DNA_ORIENTATION=+